MCFFFVSFQLDDDCSSSSSSGSMNPVSSTKGSLLGKRHRETIKSNNSASFQSMQTQSVSKSGSPSDSMISTVQPTTPK